MNKDIKLYNKKKKSVLIDIYAQKLKFNRYFTSN
jgi:hypothetical protein